MNGTRHLLDWLAPTPPQKFVYTSSTGVYGQTDGALVKEDAPTRPESATSQLLSETLGNEMLIFHILGDNGTNAEGGINGRFSEMTCFNGVQETLQDMLKHCGGRGHSGWRSQWRDSGPRGTVRRLELVSQ